MRAGIAAAVLLIALTAGCSAFAGGGGSNTPTLTPAAVPTPPPEPSDPRMGVAPGVSRTGVTHPGFLADRHVAAAAKESYAFRERVRKNRTLYNSTATVRRGQRAVVENATTYWRARPVLETRVDGQRRYRYGYREWADGTVVYTSWLSGPDGERTYRRWHNPSDHRDYAAIPAAKIEKYLALDDAEVALHAIPDSEAQYYLVTGTRDRLPRYGSVTNYTARAVIREDGFVRRLTVSYDATRNGASIAARYSFAYRNVGTATVTPPEWAEKARAAFEDTADGE